MKLVKMLQARWEECKVKKRRTVAAVGSISVRRLLSEFAVARQSSAAEGQSVLEEAFEAALQSLQ